MKNFFTSYWNGVKNGKPNISSTILRKVIQWATYHKDDPAPPPIDHKKETTADDISSWDADFLKVDHQTLLEIILAANFLDIQGLCDVSCQTVAKMLIGKNPEDMRNIFNIKNDFSLAEQEQHRKEDEEWEVNHTETRKLVIMFVPISWFYFWCVFLLLFVYLAISQ